jgi:hypothetical protein
MKRMLWVLLALALPFGVSAAAAQQREVSGTVTGSNGEAVAGAAVCARTFRAASPFPWAPARPACG